MYLVKFVSVWVFVAEKQAKCEALSVYFYIEGFIRLHSLLTPYSADAHICGV